MTEPKDGRQVWIWHVVRGLRGRRPRLGLPLWRRGRTACGQSLAPRYHLLEGDASPESETAGLSSWHPRRSQACQTFARIRFERVTQKTYLPQPGLAAVEIMEAV